MAYVIFYQFAQPLFASVRLFGELLYNFIFPFPELQLIFRWFVVFIFSFTDGIFPEFIAKVFNMLFNFCSMLAVYYAIFLQQKIKYRNTTHTWFNFLLFIDTFFQLHIVDLYPVKVTVHNFWEQGGIMTTWNVLFIALLCHRSPDRLYYEMETHIAMFRSDLWNFIVQPKHSS